MLVECNHCGAPLDVRDGRSSFVKCRYCGRTNRLQALRTVSAETPAGWRPPPRWTPPEHMPAGPTQLTYRGGPAVVVGIALAALLVVLGAVSAFVAARPRGGAAGVPGLSNGLSSGLSVAALAPITLRESPQQMAAITNASADKDNRMRVPLSGSRFDAVTFEWDADALDHVKEFYLNLSGSAPGDQAIRARLQGVLGRRFNGQQFLWEGASLYFGADGGVLSISITRSEPIGGENTRWRQQAEALWGVVREAALGLPGGVDAAAVRDWLGGGYPMSRLTAVDFNVDVDHSDAAVQSVFRGAVRSLHIDLSYTIALDHPLFGQAELQWENRKASQMKEVELRPPPGQQHFSDQQAIVACVNGAFGRPDRESEGDHLRGGGKDYTWRPRGGGQVRVYEHMVTVALRDNPFAGPMPADRYALVVRTLDACGKPAR